MYPLEIQLAQALAGGKAIEGVTWDDVHALNAKHAKENDAVTKEQALSFSGATARPQQPQSGHSVTRSWIGRLPCP
jgi:hypothetical protein